MERGELGARLATREGRSLLPLCSVGIGAEALQTLEKGFRQFFKQPNYVPEDVPEFCQIVKADPRIQAGIKGGAIEIYKP